MAAREEPPSEEPAHTMHAATTDANADAEESECDEEEHNEDSAAYAASPQAPLQGVSDSFSEVGVHVFPGNLAQRLSPRLAAIDQLLHSVLSTCNESHVPISITAGSGVSAAA